jgi:hypothetical protein
MWGSCSCKVSLQGSKHIWSCCGFFYESTLGIGNEAIHKQGETDNNHFGNDLCNSMYQANRPIVREKFMSYDNHPFIIVLDETNSAPRLISTPSIIVYKKMHIVFKKAVTTTIRFIFKSISSIFFFKICNQINGQLFY